MPKVNKTKYALLGMLLHQPMSGYDIKKRCDASISHFWSENYGHIYPILRRLAAEGLAKRVVERSKGKPDRHVYSITEEGKEAFQEWLKKPAGAEIRRNEFLLKLFFASFLPLQDVMRLVEFEKERNELAMQRYDQIEQEAAKKKDILKNKKPSWHLTLGYGKKLASARYQWCQETLQELSRQKK